MKRKQILNKIFGITMLALIGNSIIPKFIYGDEIKEAVVNDTKNYIISQQVEDKKIENTVDTDSKNNIQENIQSENSNEYNIEDEETSKSVTNSEEINSSNEIVMTSIEAIGENAASKVMAENSNLKIAVLSDTHYFSPSMISDCPDFEKDKNSDRKLLEESSSILDSALQSIKEDKPDVLIVSGDLTKDGEKKCHEEFASKLENLKKELNGEGIDIKIYVINGNHDINNSDAKDFSSGKAIDAERTSPEDFKNIYKVSYDEADDVFTPSNGVQGGLSYCATPKEGFTVIAIDSGKYSSDATDSGLDEHETSGSISEELQDWVVSKIKEAKAKGNTVIAVEHHGLVPHFETEPVILGEYLVKDYEKISKKFADAGLKYVFTGHMHSNDISKLSNNEDNTLYDIETGSIITYPCPTRNINLLREFDNNNLKETMNIKTKNIKSIDYVDPSTNSLINDLTSYSKKNCMKSVVISTAAQDYADKFLNKIESDGGIKNYLDNALKEDTGDYVIKKISESIPDNEKDAVDIKGIFKMYFDKTNNKIVFKGKGLLQAETLYITEESIKKEIVEKLLSQVDSKILTDTDYVNSVIENAVNDILAMNVYTDENGKDYKNIYDLVNYVYLANLAGDETCTPWVKEVAENFKKKTLVNSLKDILVDTCTAIVNDNKYKLDFDGDKIITRGSGILSGTFKKAAVKAMGNNLGQAIETFNIDVKEKINDIFDKALTEEVKGKIGQLAYDVIISMTNDTSYVEDNNTCIK